MSAARLHLGPLPWDADDLAGGGGGGGLHLPASGGRCRGGLASAAAWVLERHAADPAFWAQLMQHEEVAAFVLRSLKAKAQRDDAFARRIVASKPEPPIAAPGAAAPPGGAPKRLLFFESPAPTASLLPAAALSTPAARHGPAPEAVTPARRPAPRRAATAAAVAAAVPSQPRSGKRGCGEALGPAAPPAPASAPRPRAGAPALSTPTLSLGLRMSPPVVVGCPAGSPPWRPQTERREAPAPTRRSLLGAFDDMSDDDDQGEGLGQTPAKWLRSECGARAVAPSEEPAAAGPAPPADPWRGALLAPLPAPAVAAIAGFLPFADTVRLAAVVSGAQGVLEQPLCWEPLVLTRAESGVLLRRLRARDPLGVSCPDTYPLPRALSQVAEVRLELMDSDEPPLDQADGGGSATTEVCGAGGCRAPGAPPAPLVLDPLEELCKRMRRGWFSAAHFMQISNIEAHRLDYHFLALRGSAFAAFPHLRATAAANRYTVVARRGSRVPAVPAKVPRWDLRAAAALSLARQPAEAPLLLAPAEELCEEEAAFLEENEQVFKSGDNFYFSHAPWRSCAGEAVRRRYRALWQGLGLPVAPGAAAAAPLLRSAAPFASPPPPPVLHRL